MKVRIYIKENLSRTTAFALDERQYNYLVNVLRFNENDEFFVFDGQSGEYAAKLHFISHKKCEAIIVNKVKDFYKSPDIWLLFAPLKKDCTDLIIQKATELGADKIVPVITEYTNSEKVRTDRFVLQANEASEQCQRLDIPEISKPLKLEKLLENWDKNRTIFFLNEKGEGYNIIDVIKQNSGKAAILVGPEGGFSEKECKFLLQQNFVKPIYLGKRILRAETACISALACWQAANGDW